jgi:hypothetical protein
MDYDLFHDVATGCRLLRWCAARGVPMVIFCGYRLFFAPGAFAELDENLAGYPLARFANPYRYPFTEVRRAVGDTAAELWTGPCFTAGLRAGAEHQAQAFGFQALITPATTWREYQANAALSVAGGGGGWRR